MEKEKDSVTIHISDKSGKLIKQISVTIEELVICWMNFHFPGKEHHILS